MLSSTLDDSLSGEDSGDGASVAGTSGKSDSPTTTEDDEQEARGISVPSRLPPANGTMLDSSTTSTDLPLHQHLSLHEQSNSSCPSDRRAATVETTRCPRTPRSESAIRDGRKYLSAYRQQRQHQERQTASMRTSGPDPTSSNHGRNGTRTDAGSRESGKGGIDSLEVPPGLVGAFSERLERYQTCAPGLARSLETALSVSASSSPLHRKHVDSRIANKSTDNIGDNKSNSDDREGHILAGVQHDDGAIASSRLPRGDDGGVSMMEGGSGDRQDDGLPSNGRGDGGSCAATARLSPRTASNSPERPTPEVCMYDVLVVHEYGTQVIGWRFCLLVA